jgi:hypothetical protein
MKKLFLICMMITIPLVLMVGIFQIGKNIKAENPINGSWHISGTDTKEDITGCKFADFVHDTSIISIQQSGKFIHLSFDQMSIPLLRGQLSGLQLALTNHELSLTGTIDIDSLPNRMQGEIFYADCQQTYQFTAVKDELSVSLSEDD